MTDYTDEQLEYINYNGPEDTKLLACAGSGKTRCIIARMDRLIKDDIYDIQNILMLTFSRFTKDDFTKKITSYNSKYINKTCVKTIDSFAKSLIDDDNNIDVSLLSFKFMKYLEDTPAEELKKNTKLNNLKIVFVDEAQDLNDIQHSIFTQLKKKLRTNVNLIGDPNQNIYQFRGSSDKHIRNFKGKIFKLTRNFRSYEGIVSFSKYLRPFDDLNIICTKGKNKCKPIMMFHDSEKILEEDLISLLKNAQKSKMEMSDFAILSPTRGRMRGFGKSHGLCLISNILYKSGIKFKQFYEEATEDAVSGGIKYAPTKGHVNVLTYMGSKGLEWKYVIVIDADMCLINKRYFDEDKHNYDRYLLYVACSRAIDNMFIFSKYHFRHGAIEFKTNPWFDVIPRDTYQLDKDYTSHFFFPKLRYIDMGDKERRITRIISRMDEYTLDRMSKITFESKKEILYKKIYTKDYSQLNSQSSMFLGKYVEKLFHSLCDIKYKNQHKNFPDIENVIDSVTDASMIMDNVPPNVTEWFYSNRKLLTWEVFDNDGTLDKYIKDYVNKYFSRGKEIRDHTIINDGYFKWFVLSKRTWIRSVYQKYMDCTCPKKIRKYVFNMIVLTHSFDTQHYFHIKTKGEKFLHVLDTYSGMFDELEKFVSNMKYEFIDSNTSLSKWGLTGEVDIYDSKDNIWEIKCVDELTLKNFLQVIMYNIIHHDLNVETTPCCTVKFLNLLKGEIRHYKIKLSKNKINEIIETFQKSGNVLNEMDEKKEVDTKTASLVKAIKVNNE